MLYHSGIPVSALRVAGQAGMLLDVRSHVQGSQVGSSIPQRLLANQPVQASSSPSRPGVGTAIADSVSNRPANAAGNHQPSMSRGTSPGVTPSTS